MRGKLGPEIQDLVDTSLEPKATFLHIEQDNLIRASFILQPGEINDDGSLTVVGEGFSGYAHGQPYQGIFFENDIDPLDIVREIWSHLLNSPRASIGVTVDTTTSPVRVGNEVDLVNDTVKPYTLFWYDNVDCGQAIDSLAKSTPFDYFETSKWSDPTYVDVTHKINLAYPRTGTRRFDLAFISGENIVDVVLLREEPDQYASEIIVIGAGVGLDTIRGYAGNIVGNRIKQSRAILDKSIIFREDADRRAQAELRNAQAFLQIREITILDTHENASLGDFTIGDDILIQAEVYWVGQFEMWCRILGYTWMPEEGTITIQLANSDQFNYGPPPPLFI